jgi:hypothetical protein
MSEFVIPEVIAVDTVSDVTISTVKLNSVGWGYETCLFYANGDNNVVATYDTARDALTNHAHLVEQRTLQLS